MKKVKKVSGAGIVKFNAVEERIITLRGEKVLLDSDVAELYGVETREVNQAIKNNPGRFPDGYIFELQNTERQQLIKNFDRLTRLKRIAAPKAFTERGLYMLATILKGERAIQTTIAIVETFARIRELARTVAELPLAMEDEARQKSLIQKSNEIIGDILTNDLQVSSSETKYELNIATLFKVTHTVRKTKKQ